MQTTSRSRPIREPSTINHADNEITPKCGPKNDPQACHPPPVTSTQAAVHGYRGSFKRSTSPFSSGGGPNRTSTSPSSSGGAPNCNSTVSRWGVTAGVRHRVERRHGAGDYNAHLQHYTGLPVSGQILHYQDGSWYLRV